MPVPQAPKRAAPPRRRAAKSPAPAQRVPETETVESPSPLEPAAETAHTEKVEEPNVAVSEAPAALHGDHELEIAEDHVRDPVEEVADPVDPIAAEEEHEHEPPSVDEQVLQSEPEHPEPVHIQEPVVEAVAEDTADHQGGPQLAQDVEAPEVAPAEPEEEDEEARRKRIADRIARSGGFNPFAGGMPPPPIRRDSTDSARSPQATSPPPPPRRSSQHDNEPRAIPPAGRKESVGSVHGAEVEFERSERKYSTDGN